jgi:LPXTG-motif cell wall-anchored protein
LGLDPATVTPGGSVVAFSRTTCVDGVMVNLAIQPEGDATDAICVDNSFAGRLTAPSTPGTYDVTASTGRQMIAEATLTVRAAFGGAEQPLPSTGPDDAVPLAVIGAVLVGGGGVMLGLGQVRRRRLDRLVRQ